MSNTNKVRTKPVPGTGALEQVPGASDQVPGAQAAEQVPALNDKQVPEQVPNQVPAPDQVPTEQVPTQPAQSAANITPITAARKHTRKQPNQVPDDQTPISGTDASNGPFLSETEGTGVVTSNSAGAKQVRKGRQPGAKDLKPRKKRYGGSITANIPPDEKQIIVRHNVEVWSLGKLQDRNNEEEVRERIATYFSICEKNQQMPTVAGLALAFGIDRATLWTWIDNKTGVIKNQEVLDTLKGVYNLISSQYEGMLTQGKITPVSAFFLLQNNFGYKNQTDHVVVAAAAEDPETGDIVARAGLLTDGEP